MTTGRQSANSRDIPKTQWWREPKSPVPKLLSVTLATMLKVSSTRAFLVGGGIGSLAAAAFMIRDGGLAGENISIFEADPLLGGSLDGAGNAVTGYSMRGGRMLTTDNYECTWDLYKSIPSLNHMGKTVFEETVAFNEQHVSNSMARLVDRRRAKIPVTSMGFSMRDRMELLKLSQTSEETLTASRITDWLSPPFFETEFWNMWSTTFAFQPWHSAIDSSVTCFVLSWSSHGSRLWQA